MSSETDAILYSRPTYPGWAGVCSIHEETCPACGGTGHMEWAADVVGNCTECHGFGVREVEHSPAVIGDVLPEEVQAILALTPGLPEETDWAAREELAAAIADTAAKGLVDSWWAFAEQPVNMDANGDVWA